ncbi:MAG: hypothetical protein ACJASX_000952 [Limisphaerales bacterium]|jgi:hypothetical protein
MAFIPLDEDRLVNADRGEILTALFEQLVMQQTNMALMLLGKIPHPETNESIYDLEGAKIFVDQLEMLAAKTRGNLNPAEEELIRKSLAAAQSALIGQLEEQVGEEE